MHHDTSKLNGKRIAALAADGFEYIELSVPRAALRAAGATVDVISLRRGKIRGMNLTEATRKVRVDRTLDETDPDAYDALFLPGGFISPDFLRQSREARCFVSAFEDANKPIATLCHGPWLLVSAELVAGRRLASWPGIRDDIVHAGGIWRDEEVVVDRNWVSSRSPADLYAFVPAMLALYGSGAPILEIGAADADTTIMEMRVAGADELVDDGLSSPQYEAPVPWALAAARALPRPRTVRTLTAAALGTALGAFARHRAAG